MRKFLLFAVLTTSYVPCANAIVACTTSIVCAANCIVWRTHLSYLRVCIRQILSFRQTHFLISHSFVRQHLIFFPSSLPSGGRIPPISASASAKYSPSGRHIFAFSIPSSASISFSFLHPCHLADAFLQSPRLRLPTAPTSSLTPPSSAPINHLPRFKNGGPFRKPPRIMR